MRFQWMPRGLRTCLAAVATSTVVASAALTPVMGWTAPAEAFGVTTSCGPGVEYHNCPPLCSKLLSAATVSRIFHVRLGKTDWHVDGEPQDTCTYAEVSDPNSTVSDTIDGHATLADFNAQVKITKAFNPKSIVQRLPSLGKYAIDIVHCMGGGPSAWCFPNVVVFSKGYLVQIGEGLGTPNLATMDKTYVPEVEAWVKALVAKA